MQSTIVEINIDFYDSWRFYNNKKEEVALKCYDHFKEYNNINTTVQYSTLMIGIA